MAHLTKVRTALVALTANDRVREAHSYEYDNNGNIVYIQCDTSFFKYNCDSQIDGIIISMKHLYIIGNGFDLHHEMKTSYPHFREWLEANDT